MSKSPAFQWYAADYLADERVMQLTLEAEGAYIRLLSYCWREGSIPANLALLPPLCKYADVKIIKAALALFTKAGAPPGRLIHKRLEEERAKQEAHRAKQAENGRAGGRPKKATPNPNESQNNPPLFFGETQTEPNESFSISSSTSISSSIENTSSLRSEVAAPEKKIGEAEVGNPLPESPATELRTPGGAADVGTSVGGSDKPDTPAPLTKQRGGKKLPLNPASLTYPGELDDVAFVAVFTDFVKYRADKNKPMSAGGADALLKKLAIYSVEFAAELVLNAQANDYQGVVFDNTPEKYQRWQASRATPQQPNPQQHAVTRPSYSSNANGAAARLQTPTPDATSANPWGLPAYTPPAGAATLPGGH